MELQIISRTEARTWLTKRAPNGFTCSCSLRKVRHSTHHIERRYLTVPWVLHGVLGESYNNGRSLGTAAFARSTLW